MRMLGVVPRYARLARCYWSDAATVRDFARIMQVRLAQSKVGRWVCPRPIEPVVSLHSLGGEVRLRSHTSDVSVLGELIVSDGYAVAPESLPSPPRTIVDLGANTGLTARWMLHAWPGARIVAIEPEPGNVAVLRANVADHDVVVVPAAVGATERTAVLHTTMGEHGFTLVGEPVNDTAVEVPVMTMRRILDDAGVDEVDLLKVDIEGAEQELFADCSDWIGIVRALLVECHGGYTVAGLSADLERAGAAFTLVHLESKPAYGFEVGMLRAL